MSFSSREFRDALGRFATGVCLVTTIDSKGDAIAVTVNSFSSVSLEPPLILWSVQKDSDVYDVFTGAQQFAVGILAEEQETYSTAYAQKDGHRLCVEHFSAGHNGAPLVEGTLASFECSLEQVLEGGDHTILLGRVTRVVTAAGDDGAPLLFFGGAYRQLS